MGSPMLLLCPKEPVRAEPDKVIEFRLSTPIAFEAAAMTELAFCAAKPIDNDTTTSTATVIFPSRITDPPFDIVFKIGNFQALLRMVVRRANRLQRIGATGWRHRFAFQLT